MLKESDLAGFTGTEGYYSHFIGNFKFTDGVHYLAEHGKCYWLLDLIGSYQMSDKKIRNMHYQFWKLKVNEDKSAVVTMKEDSDQPVVVKQRIPCTDFPLDAVELWMIGGVLILPSEY